MTSARQMDAFADVLDPGERPCPMCGERIPEGLAHLPAWSGHGCDVRPDDGSRYFEENRRA